MESATDMNNQGSTTTSSSSNNNISSSNNNISSSNNITSQSRRLKTFKRRNFQFANEQGATDRNLIAVNEEILIMLAQNNPVLSASCLFGDISFVIQIELPQQTSHSNPFVVHDMRFLSDAEQRAIHAKTALETNRNSMNAQQNVEEYKRKNILAIIDNMSRVLLFEIVVDYKERKICTTNFINSPYIESQPCLQIVWVQDHLCVLKENNIIIDRQLNLHSQLILSQNQYKLNESLGCRSLIAIKLNSQRFYGISQNGSTVFMHDLLNQDESAATTINGNAPVITQIVLPVNDLCFIFKSRDNDIIVLSKSGRVFALSSQDLHVIDQFNLNQFKSASESIVEADMDNTATSLFALTSKNSKILQVTIERVVHRSSGEQRVFTGACVHRFKIDGSIYTFRVLAIPAVLSNSLFVKGDPSLREQADSLQASLTPGINSMKFLIFSFLHSEEAMRIFAFDLSSVTPIIDLNDFTPANPNASLMLSATVPSSNQEITSNIPASQPLGGVVVAAASSTSNLIANTRGDIQDNNFTVMQPGYHQETQLLQQQNQISDQQQKQFQGFPVLLEPVNNNNNNNHEEKTNDFIQHFLLLQQQQWQQRNPSHLQQPTQQLPQSLQTIQGEVNPSQNLNLSSNSSKWNAAVGQNEEDSKNKDTMNVSSTSLQPFTFDPMVGLQFGLDQSIERFSFTPKTGIVPYQNQQSGEPSGVRTGKDRQARGVKGQLGMEYLSLSQQNSENVSQRDQRNEGILSIDESRIKNIFNDNIERLTNVLNANISSRTNKLDAQMNSKIEKARNKEDMATLISKESGDYRAFIEQLVHEEIAAQCKAYGEQNLKENMSEVFESVNKLFEKGQKFYLDKISSEKEKCKIQSNSNEILAIVKKITGQFSDASISHKKILTELVALSQDKKQKAEFIEQQKQFASIVSKQDLIFDRIINIENQLQKPLILTAEQIATQIKNTLKSNPKALNDLRTLDKYKVQSFQFPNQQQQQYQQQYQQQHQQQQQQQYQQYYQQNTIIQQQQPIIPPVAPTPTPIPKKKQKAQFTPVIPNK